MMNLFALCKNDDSDENKYAVRRIPLNSELQLEITTLFIKHKETFLAKNPAIHEFTGNWKAEDDELFFISTPDEISDVIAKVKKNIISLEILDLKKIDETPIKALFMYDKVNKQLLVQKFTKNQILQRKFAIFFDNETYNKIDSEAIIFDTKLLCIVDSERILFNSFSNMRMSFAMKAFYVEATNEEITNFFDTNDKIHVDDIDIFKNTANQTIRKLINNISKSQVLDKLTVNQIYNYAKKSQLGHLIQVENGKINLPSEKEPLIATLSLLDEKLYKGVFSSQTLITNSTRTINI